ncbi:MAG: hypothetical protein J7M25_09005 [Deltaproteobacteria bacterium]|nr:hypothetical protein [Deltaproteobacteria bacterium]
MRDLTDRQRQVLDFVTNCIQEQGYPPTLREIGDELGIRSPNGVFLHLKALERKGYLVRDGGKSRSLRPVSTIGRAVTVPMVHSQSHEDLEAPHRASQTVSLDRLIVGPSADLFVVRVSGGAVLCEGVAPGDYLVVRRGGVPSVGETMVLVEGGRMVLRRRQKGGVVAGRAEKQVRAVEPAISASHPTEMRGFQGGESGKNSRRTTTGYEANMVGVVQGLYRRL